jgi:hypothetical protein
MHCIKFISSIDNGLRILTIFRNTNKLILISRKQFSSANNKNVVDNDVKLNKYQTDSKHHDKQTKDLDSDVETIVDDSNLQSQWASLEKRVLNRKPNTKKPSGRHNLHKSAWDHEHV